MQVVLRQTSGGLSHRCPSAPDRCAPRDAVVPVQADRPCRRCGSGQTPLTTMAQYVLEILDGDRAGEVLPVTDQPLRIGRKPSNDLVLADEKTSGVHCEVVREGDRHVLRDLGSTNGTFLDGRRITELVLSPGDVVTVGRLRVKFRDREAAAGAPTGGEFAVHRLDAGRVAKKGGSLGLVAALAVLVVAGGGYFWWQSGAGGGDGPKGPRVKEPLAVAGNKLPAAVATCEGEDGWSLRAAGAGFQLAANGHTGRGAFEALRGEGAEAATFALATLAEPLPVLAGRTLTLAAHVQGLGGGQVAVRAVCFSTNEAMPFRYRHGTPLQGADGWQRVECSVLVPSGCDRLQIELCAVLPDAASSVRVDDVALTELAADASAGAELDLPDSNQKGLRAGSAFAVRSTDADNPVTLFEVLPGEVPPALSELRAAGLLCLSDVGAGLAVTASERSFEVAVQYPAGSPASGAELVFPSAAAGDPLALELAGAGDASGQAAGGFVSVAADSAFTARGLLLGSGATRALVQTAAPSSWRGALGSGLFRLRLAAAEFELVLGFRAVRIEAAALLREAQAAPTPGAALDLLRRLGATVPQDSAVLAQARALRSELLARQADAVAALQRDFDEAQFFDTRGGYQRTVAGLEQLVADYGTHNLEDRDRIEELRTAAKGRLQARDDELASAVRQRLTMLGDAFAEQEQPGLAALVRAYMARELGNAREEGK